MSSISFSLLILITFIFSKNVYSNNFAFPKNVYSKRVVFVKQNVFKEKIMSINNLARKEPIWCSMDCFLDNNINQDLYLISYSGDIDKSKFNIEKYLKKSFKNIFYKKEHNCFKDLIYKDFFITFEDMSDISIFKFYFFIKRKYFKSNLCLYKGKSTYVLKYFANSDNCFKDLIKQYLKEYKQISKEEKKKNYNFFLSYFYTKSDKTRFYYQMGLHGFYGFSELLNISTWLKEN